MRTRNGYVGATLLYGPQSPVLPHVLQFLLHDLYLEGRAVSGVQLKGPTLRLRFEGYELILTQSDQPLPARAFEGALRPRRALPRSQGSAAPRPAGEGISGDEGQVVADMARGRVLHALRNHRYALSVLLRARGGRRSDDPPDAFAQLAGECRAMLEAVIEATPPRAVVWQPGAVAFTCEEFLASRAETLLDGGDPANVLSLSAHAHAVADRPALADWSLSPASEPSQQGAAPTTNPPRQVAPPPAPAPRDAPAPAPARHDPLLPPALSGEILPHDEPAAPQARQSPSTDWAEDDWPAQTAPARAAPEHTPAATGARGGMRTGGDAFPAARPPQRSSGRLFGTGRQPAALPRLYRQDEKLAQALRARATPETAGTRAPASRPLQLARVASVLTLLLSGLLLAPLLGLF